MSWLDGLRHRLHVVLHADEYAREQADERRFHREMDALHGTERGDVLSAGSASPPPASPSPPRSPLPQRLADALRQDVGVAVRSLVRKPGFTLLATLTLALGVGANGAVFSVLDQLFGQPPSGLDEPDDLRRLYLRFPDHPFEPGMVFPFFHYPAFAAVDAALDGGLSTAAWTPSRERALEGPDGESTARTAWVTHDYFDVVGVAAQRGRVLGSEEAGVEVPRPVAVISHGFWERAYSSDPDVLGRTFRTDGTTFTIVGVARAGFGGLDLSYTDVFLPLNTFPASGRRGLSWYEGTGNYLHVVARAGEGLDEQLAERATAAYALQTLPEGQAPDSTAEVLSGSIIAARGVGAEAGTDAANQAVSLSMRMAGVSLMVLLIAGANLAGLVLVRSARRRHEIGVRRALGVSRLRLTWQLATEGVLLTALALVAAVPLAGWGGATLRRLLLPDIRWADGALDTRAVVVAALSALAVGLAAALAPTLQSWWGSVGVGLRSGGRRGGRTGSKLRTGLLAAQVALALVLLGGAGLFLRSLHNVAAIRLGFDVDELAWVSVRGEGASEPGVQRELAARLATFAGVRGVAVASAVPMHGTSSIRVAAQGWDSLPDLGPGAYPTFNTVSPEFFEVTGMRRVAGRTFQAGDVDAVVVSEFMAATLWPGETALGKCLHLGNPPGPCQEVVGIVEDSRRWGLFEDPALKFFRPRLAEATGGTVLLRVDPARWASIAAAIRGETVDRWGARNVSIGRMPDSLEPQMRPWRLGAQLFTAFGLLALLVTVVGIYSVMAYAVGQRTHEMGVRMALGARLRTILTQVVGEGLRVVAAGVAVGLAAALALGRIVESLLYGVAPTDLPALSAAAAVLLVTGAVASLVPALRAGRVDPARTLREE